LSVTVKSTAGDPYNQREDLAVTVAQIRHISLAAFLMIVFIGGSMFAQVTADRNSDDSVFVHVNVLPMDADHILRDQTVLVENGRIKAIGPSIPIPKGSNVIDGHGDEFLSPGLADMHVHSDTSRDMAVFLANGVTTVLNMGDARSQFMTRTRPAVNRGELPGPHVYTAFMIDGSPDYGEFFVTDPSDARAVVRLAKANGYDFIKVYVDLSPECFEALAEEGRRQGIPLVGHGVYRVGLERQMAAGQILVAHTEEYFYTVFTKPGAKLTDATPSTDQIPAAIAMTKHYGAFVTADLNTYATIAGQLGKPAVVDDFLKKPEVRYLDPDNRIAWRQSGYQKRTNDFSSRVEFLKIFTKALSDAGVPLITGTDTPPIPGLVPGFSLHDDLRALHEAGLSNYQVLSAATRTPGEFIRLAQPNSEPFGMVAPGNRADLILTAANPQDDLATLRRPLGVMAKGRWYTATDLQKLLDSVAQQYLVSSQPR
jgi:Amidohydrolase family